MYAAAIWDRRLRTLTLARDPLGIKPLFITEQAGGYAFASEISALRDVPGFEFDIDDRGIDDFFRFGHVLGPRTIFRQVRALEPGHVMTIGSVGSATRRFWTATVRTRTDLSENEWIEQARESVLGTVRQHMISDVPVGVFLSGGVDSERDRRRHGAGFGRGQLQGLHRRLPGIQDRRELRRIGNRPASRVRAHHPADQARNRGAMSCPPSSVRSMSRPRPIRRIPLWYLSRAAAKHVKVVLCGEGGDEFFMGYKRQRWAQRMGQWSPVIRALGGLDFVGRIPEPAGAQAQLPQGTWRTISRRRAAGRRFRAIFRGGDDHPARRSANGSTIMIFAAPLPARRATALPTNISPAAQAGLSPLEQFVLGDLTVHMPASLLQRLDRSSMAHSLEARVPFLTHSFVDWP